MTQESEQFPQQRRVDGGCSVSFKQLRKQHTVLPGLPKWDEQQRTGEQATTGMVFLGRRGHALGCLYYLYTKYPVASYRNLETHKLISESVMKPRYLLV